MRNSSFIVYKDALDAPSDVSITFSEDAKTMMVVANHIASQITWDQLINHAEAGDYDRWILSYLPEQGSSISSIPPLYNAHAMTATTKQEFKDAIPFLPPGTKWLHIFIRPGDSNFREAFYIVNLHPEAVAVFDPSVTVDIRERQFTSGRKAYHFDMNVSGPSTVGDSGGLFTITVDRPASCYAYLKTDYGFVPRKVKLENGQGTFSFQPFGMSPGEEAQIKVGFRHWSNYSSIKVTKV